MGQAYPRGATFDEPGSSATILPAGTLARVKIPLLAEARTNDQTKLKYDANMGWQVLAIVGPPALAAKSAEFEGGALYDHNAFIIGRVDGDGQLVDPNDWVKRGDGRGGPLFNQLRDAAGVPEYDDADDICNEMAEKTVIVKVRLERGTLKPGADPTSKDLSDYYPDKNRFEAFFPDVAAPVAPTRPAIPTARLAQPAQPAQAIRPVTLIRPAQPAPRQPVQQTAAARPATTAKAATLPCTLCSPPQPIERTSFGRHVSFHETYQVPDGVAVPAELRDDDAVKAWVSEQPWAQAGA